MKHQATLDRIREERAAARLVEAVLSTAREPVNAEVLAYQETISKALDSIYERLSGLLSTVDNLSKAIDALSEKEPPEETDLSPLREGMRALANQIAKIEVSPIISTDEIVNAVVNAIPPPPEPKKWRFDVKRNSQGFIKEVIAE